MSDALELVLRYLVAAGCGWLVQHGVAGLGDPSMVAALTTIAGGVILWLLTVSRGLAKSTVAYMVARLKARHRTELVAAAADVPGVSKIVVTSQLAADTASSKVVS